MSNSDALAALLLMWLLIIPVIFIIGYVVSALFIRKLLVTAGAQNPNLAWIPIFNVMLWAKLVDISPWVYLIAAVGAGILSSIPVIGQIIALVPLALMVVMILRTNQKLGKDPVGWTIFGALLSFIWMLVLTFSKDLTWRTGTQSGVPVPFWHKWGAFFHDTTTFGGIPDQGYPVQQGAAGPTQAPPPAAAPQTPPPAAPPAAPPPAV